MLEAAKPYYRIARAFIKSIPLVTLPVDFVGLCFSAVCASTDPIPLLGGTLAVFGSVVSGLTSVLASLQAEGMRQASSQFAFPLLSAA